MHAHPGSFAPAGSPEAGADAPLGWVYDEIHAALGNCIGGAKAFLGAKSDPTPLREAIAQAHQAAGALHLLDLPGPARLIDTVEAVLQRWQSQPEECLPAALRTLESALGAIESFLQARLEGRDVAAMRLYPAYREVLGLRRSGRAHPADLLFPDLSRRPPQEAAADAEGGADALRVCRVAYEEGLLRFLREPEQAAGRERLHEAVQGISRLPQHGLSRGFWWVANALFGALAGFHLAVDEDFKGFLARLNLQIRRQIEGGPAVAERLMVEALYHVARADPADAAAAEVQRLYGLEALIPADYEAGLPPAGDGTARSGLFTALGHAQEQWAQVAMAAPPDTRSVLAALEQARALAAADSARADAVRLLDCLLQVVRGLPAAQPAAREGLALEVATALLLLEDIAGIRVRTEPAPAARVNAMIERLQRAALGLAQTQGGDWIAELAREVQEHGSLDSVATEMGSVLREVELRLDRFFRDPDQHAELAEIDPMLEQVGGALSVLGHADPAAALVQVRRQVRRFIDAATPPQAEQFARVANDLGAIGFFIAGIGRGPGLSGSDGQFAYDPVSGSFSANLAPVRGAPGSPAAAAAHPQGLAGAHGAGPAPLPENLPPDGAATRVEQAILEQMERAREACRRLVAKPADQRAINDLAPAIAQLSRDAELTDDASLRQRTALAARLLEDLRESPQGAGAAALLALFAPVTEPALPSAPLPDSPSAADRELRDVFVEEADEVLESIAEQLARLRLEPEDGAALTLARRAFHTLKGSSRMVGLREFGEFAWALEQCFNVWLAQERPANADLLELALASADRMRDWIEALRLDEGAQVDAQALVHAAHVVRDGGPFTLPFPLHPEDLQDHATPTIEVLPAPAPFAPAELHAGAEDELRDEDLRHIGPVTLSHGLYAVFLNEADECLRAIALEVGEWRYEPGRAPGEHLVRRAHTFSGISETVGLDPVRALAEPIDGLLQLLHGQSRTGSAVPTLDGPQFDILERALERARGMLHQFAAGVFPDPAPLEAAALEELVMVIRSRLQGAAAPTLLPPLGIPGALPLPAQAAAQTPVETVEEAPAQADAAGTPEPEQALPAPTDGAGVEVADIEGEPLRDEVDEDLLGIFSEEAEDHLPALARGLRSIASEADPRESARELMRRLHTLKGSARMAGAMRLGDVFHRMESQVEAAAQLRPFPSPVAEELQGRLDHALAQLVALRQPGAITTTPGGAPVQAHAAAVAENLAAGVPGWSTTPGALPSAASASAVSSASPTPAPASGPGLLPALAEAAETGGAAALIRVRADVVDRLVDHAGEVSITRSRLETGLVGLRSGLADLGENIQRLRGQLREVEMQADAQLQARSDQVAKQSSNFDPLEFDRYSRLQELTRMLAESVEDVALVQSGMLRGLGSAENDLVNQSRLTRELQQQLMRVRMVPFSSISERLYRVARQTAKELDKRVRLDITGGDTGIDRSLLEQMAGPFEHLVRNAIVHGLEAPLVRAAAGKDETGELRLAVRREGNEVLVTFEDDGRGIDLERVRLRAVEAGLLAAERRPEARELLELIFSPGLSTAAQVTELAGRGVGLDIVREQARSLGGRVTVSSEAGQGSRFTLALPMTLSIMQVVLAHVGERRFALPAAMVEQVRRVRSRELGLAIRAGSIAFAGVGAVTLRPLAQLTGGRMPLQPNQQYSLALLRAGEDRLAVCAEDLSANQEVVVKPVGPQLARLPGILGASVLGDGQVVLIMNPLPLIARAPEPPESPEETGTTAEAAGGGTAGGAAAGAALGASVMVVDDSLTVRRVTQRLLERNGLRPVLAKDGIDALREVQEHVPDLMLVDIEMPRMDGYDLVRALRSGEATRAVPIIMITSRTAEKHRRLAFELGVDEYLGKPYREDELMELIRRLLAGGRAAGSGGRAGGDFSPAA
jgi:chemosensory pili system protein ChpA (sensor histidine kinase/response regulator)